MLTGPCTPVYPYNMNTTATDIEAGMTVTATPVGQKRKQTIYVTDVTDVTVAGEAPAKLAGVMTSSPPSVL